MLVLCLEASLSPIATGKVPAISAMEVMRIGRKRVLPARMSAVTRSRPSSRIVWLALSTSRIAFFDATPISITIPRIEKRFNDSRQMKSPRNAPQRAMGRESKIVTGVMGDS